MKSLPKPAFDARSTLELCADNVEDEDFRDRLKAIADDIEVAETTYEKCGKKAELFTIPESDNVAGKVTTEEMRRLYKGTFSRVDTPTRAIYDEIKAAPKNDICPLCGQRVVSTLDHYLAQSRHPAYAVSPINLVPACSDCNKIKLAKQAGKASEQTLHPYFDNVDEEVWLVAKVQENVSPALEFEAIPPATWTDLKRERLCNHFNAFELAKLYSIQAAVELIDIRDRLLKAGAREGPAGVRLDLEESAVSRRAAQKNSWRAAFYTALSESDWFCEEGYTKIPESS
jgi:hypothetical protein